jgi:lipoprotein-releasing system ATP-binding protein
MLLELNNVTKTYDAVDQAVPPAVLQGIDLHVQAGESLSIVGPSGSGKSTLMHIIGTLDTATSGSVKLDGVDLTTLNETQLASVRNEKIGFVFQLHHLLPQCSVLENVLVPTLAQPNNAPTAASSEEVNGNMIESASDRAVRLLERVGLSHRLNHRPAQLSGGEQQRVAVVRALINQPQLLLADEPTGALDHETADQLAQLLIELNREEGVTLIVVTHAMQLARQMSRVMTIFQGRLVQADAAASQVESQVN